MKHPAPAAQEHGETITLHRVRTDDPWTECRSTHVGSPAVYEHRTAHFVPPATAKQPEQTAPEARRWTLHLMRDDVEGYRGERYSIGHVKMGRNDECDSVRHYEVIDAAYHDAAMEQAKGLLEAGKKIFDFSRTWTAIDWLAKRVAVYRWFKEFERALGGPR